MNGSLKKTLLLLAAGALVFAACGRPDKTKAAAKTIRIAVIPKGMTHEFWKSIHAGALQAARELGVEILWKGPQKEDDRAQQITVVEDVLSRGVDGIVLAPLDDRALMRPVQDAMRENIPVVIIDSGLQGKDYVSFVATDNFRGGVMAARRIGELLDVDLCSAPLRKKPHGRIMNVPARSSIVLSWLACY